MGQVSVPSRQDILLTATDRLQARNAGAGNTGDRVVLFGSNAGLNSAIADKIIIGNEAFKAGFSDTAANGMIVIGAQAAQNLTATDATAGGSATIVIGFQTIQLATTAGSGVYIGAKVGAELLAAAGNPNGYQRNVVIGAYSARNIQATNGFPFSDNVLIGGRAVIAGALDNNSVLNCVVIGAQACDSLGSGAGILTQCVYIGFRAGRNATSNVGQNVAIGSAAGNTLGSGTTQTILGSNANVNGGNRGVYIGADNGSTGPNSGDDCVMIGYGITNRTTMNRVILIGRGCGESEPNTNNDVFLIETFDGVGTRRNVMYGNLATGNILTGLSTPGTNRDLPGTNIHKILNGTKSGAAPVGGGFFYGVAGVLHWVDTANVDSVLSPGAGQLAASTTAYTNNAAAAAATIANAPVAGNPTKWIPINDNGTIRNIPAW